MTYETEVGAQRPLGAYHAYAQDHTERQPFAMHRAWSNFEGVPAYIGHYPLAVDRAWSTFEGFPHI